MKRRTFISLASFSATYWLPLDSSATQNVSALSAPPNSSADLDSHRNISAESQFPYEATLVKVIGVGGAGRNAINQMIHKGVGNVEFMVADSDTLELQQSLTEKRIWLGKTELNANDSYETGSALTPEVRERIADALKDTHMLFIVAGMGGMTGTRTTAAIADVARQLGIFTVATVIMPFSFEGKRMRIAETGIAEIRKHVDSLFIYRNEAIFDLNSESVSLSEAFNTVNNELSMAISGITEIINIPGLVNVDFDDVKTVISASGTAHSSSAYASGSNRARMAIEQAIASPFLGNIKTVSAKSMLINLTSTRSLKMREVNDVMTAAREYASDDAHIIFGCIYDESMGDTIRVTVIAIDEDSKD